MASRFGIAFQEWRSHSWGRKIFDIVVWLFALAGFSIIMAWAVYRLGFTNNSGSVDRNSRFMLEVDEMESMSDSTVSQQRVQQRWMQQYVKLAAFSQSKNCVRWPMLMVRCSILMRFKQSDT